MANKFVGGCVQRDQTQTDELTCHIHSCRSCYAISWHTPAVIDYRRRATSQVW